jgi:H+/Cl- antiporter ClcA
MVSLNVFAIGFTIINGHNFIYQVALGIIMGIVVIVIANALDDSISLLTLKVGFFSKSSKKYTFLFLVILLFVFSLCLIFMIVAESKTLIELDWFEHYGVSLK